MAPKVLRQGGTKCGPGGVTTRAIDGSTRIESICLGIVSEATHDLIDTSISSYHKEHCKPTRPDSAAPVIWPNVYLCVLDENGVAAEVSVSHNKLAPVLMILAHDDEAAR